MSYLALPVVLFFWAACWLATGRKPFLKLADIDVNTGRREIDQAAINADKANIAAYPALKRVAHKMFL